MTSQTILITILKRLPVPTVRKKIMKSFPRRIGQFRTSSNRFSVSWRRPQIRFRHETKHDGGSGSSKDCHSEQPAKVVGRSRNFIGHKTSLAGHDDLLTEDTNLEAFFKQVEISTGREFRNSRDYVRNITLLNQQKTLKTSKSIIWERVFYLLIAFDYILPESKASLLTWFLRNFG